MALANQGGDDPTQDLENLDITACKEKILQLQAERERRRESTERLQEKLKALNNELAARKEEADRLKKELTGVHTRNREENKRQRQAGEAKEQAVGILGEDMAKSREKEKQIDNVRRFIEESLQEQTKGGAERNELGIRTYTETELMVEKPEKEQEEEAALIDTVLITYNLPNSELRYNLSYRVDKETRSSALREDACLFWGISEVEFILKTDDNSKVHDDLTCQSCFQKGEVAHLFLSQKTPKNQSMLDSEREAIKAKIGKDARKKVSKAAENNEVGLWAKGNDLSEQMKAVPGLFQFMTQRDQNAIEHLDRIKLRNLLLFFFLAVLTILSFFNVRVPSQEYYTRYGPLTAMTHHRFDSTNNVWIPDFNDIRSDGEARMWLMNVIPNELFVNTSLLRTDNVLPGWMQLRMQHVVEASHEECLDNGIKPEWVPDWIPCTPENYDSTTAGKEDIVKIQRYWDGFNTTNITNVTADMVNYTGVAGLDGRSSETKPWQYRSPASQEKDGVTSMPGELQRFDAGGYVADYNLQPEDLNATYWAVVQDLQTFLQLMWVSNRTRSLSLSFMSYNGNFDTWVYSYFLLEYSTVGVVFPSHEVILYTPSAFITDSGRTQLVYDGLRCLCILYLFPYQMYWEIKYERRKGKTAWSYILGQMGLCDIGIVGGFVFIFLCRFVLYGDFGVTLSEEFTSVQTKFISMHSWAEFFMLHTILEAPLLIVIVLRLFTQLRFIRQTFIIYRTLLDALVKYSHFMLTLIPVMIGCIAISHCTWSAHATEHRSFMGSVTTVLMDLYGRTRTEHTTNYPWTVIYMILFYVVAFLMFVNGWVAVLIETYQKTRVSCGYRPSSYRWREYQYVTWILWRPLKSLYLAFLRPRTTQPTKSTDEDE